MTFMTPIELAVSTHQGLAVTTVNALFVVVVFTEMFVPVSGSVGSLWPTAEEGKVLCECRYVPVLDSIHCLASRTLDLIVYQDGARVVPSCSPLTTSITDI